ncbi:hypothetical protein [Pararobbsia alpina]|uniref:hypothetical protein n=1 Tax=Pararobbsia alpina TaxID=621374 RepID=UPI0039A73A73
MTQVTSHRRDRADIPNIRGFVQGHSRLVFVNVHGGAIYPSFRRVSMSFMRDRMRRKRAIARIFRAHRYVSGPDAKGLHAVARLVASSPQRHDPDQANAPFNTMFLAVHGNATPRAARSAIRSVLLDSARTVIISST